MGCFGGGATGGTDMSALTLTLQAEKGEYLCSLERRLELLDGLLALLQMRLSLMLC